MWPFSNYDRNRDFTPFYKFNPQTDISAYELALLLKAIRPSISTSVVNKLPVEFKRNVELVEG